MRAFLFLLLSGTLQAQNITVSGTVVEGKEGLAGVSVSHKGQNTYTNSEGKFALDLPPGNILLHFAK